MAENLKVNNYHAMIVGFKKKMENNLYKQFILEFLDTIQCHLLQCFVIKLFIARDKQKQINDRTNLAPTPVPYLAVQTPKARSVKPAA